MRILLRVAAALLWLLFGLAAGIVSAFLQSVRWITATPLGTWTVPWGLIASWVALLLLVRGAIWAMRTRWGGWAVLLGWLVGTIVMSIETQSGDLAMSAGGRQEIYLVGGAILGAFAAILPMRLRPAPPSGGTPAESPSSEEQPPSMQVDDGT